MLKSFQDFIQRSLSRSGTAVKFIMLLKNQCDMVIQYHLTKYSDADSNGENLFLEHVAAQCNTIIDVGANKGAWTRHFLQLNPSTKAILLEPSKSAFDYLTDSFKDLKNVMVLNVAASDCEGEADFFEEPDYGEKSSLVSSFSNDNAIKTRVRMITIDSLVKTNGISEIDYLKIDAEGFDFLVMKGAEKTLKEKKIKFLQFEYNGPWAETSSTLKGAMNFLNRLGYEIFILKIKGLYKLNYRRYGEYFRYSNFIAMTPEKTRELQHLFQGEI